jgi:hypothetical protein
VNAAVSREFVGMTVKEIGDLYGEARGVHRALSDAHADLSGFQLRMRAVVDEATRLGLIVREGDGGRARCHRVEAPGVAAEPSEAGEGKRKALEAEINRIRDVAAEVDENVAATLARIHRGDPHDADGRYVTVDSVEVERAEQLVARARTLAATGEKLSEARLRELDLILEGNVGDAEFATGFHWSFGEPEEVLEFYGRTSTCRSGAGCMRTPRAAEITSDWSCPATLAERPAHRSMPYPSRSPCNPVGPSGWTRSCEATWW